MSGPSSHIEVSIGPYWVLIRDARSDADLIHIHRHRWAADVLEPIAAGLLPKGVFRVNGTYRWRAWSPNGTATVLEFTEAQWAAFVGVICADVLLRGSDPGQEADDA